MTGYPCKTVPMIRLALFIFWLPLVAFAEVPLTGAEFDAYTKDKTLTYLENGQPYGIEEYRPGQQVRWAFDGSECQDGHWWEAATGMICFSYDSAPDAVQCWNFFLSGKGLRAIFLADDPGRELYEARASRAPLQCLGPKIGV